MKKTLVLLVGMLFATICGTATSQQYYNISPKYIYEHQTMDSTHVGVVSADTIWFNKTAATKDVNLYRSSANRLRTSDSLTVDGNVTVSGRLGVGTTTPQNSIQVGNVGAEFGAGVTIKQAGTDAYGFLSVAKNTDAFIRIGHTSTEGEIETSYNATAGYTPMVFLAGGQAVITLPAAGTSVNFPNGTAALPSIAGINDPNTGMRFPGVDTLAFSTGGSERVRIDPSGNVGIGTTGPGVSRLAVVGTGISIGLVAADTTLNAHQLRINNGGTYSEIVAGETAFANTSDESVKENILPVDADSIYAIVRKMNYPRKWNYKPSVIRTQSEIDRINEATSDKVVSPIVQTRIDSLIKAKATGTFTVNTTQVSSVGYKKAIASIEPSYVRVGLAEEDKAIVVPADTTWKDIPETTYVARYDTIYTCSDSKRTQIQNAVLASQQAKATSELAAYEARIAKDAARPHVSVMAQDMYPISRLMKGAAAKETTLSGDDLINALLIAVKKQDERITQLEKRVSELETR